METVGVELSSEGGKVNAETDSVIPSQHVNAVTTAESNKQSEKEDATIRKIVCRYGSGCTHILDPIHKERFWHPRPPPLTGEIYLFDEIIILSFRIDCRPPYLNPASEIPKLT